MTAVGLLRPAPRLWDRLRSFFAARADVDSALVRRAQSGDRDAFTRIVEQYDDQLRGLAFRLLGDRDAMDDALQEAYVKAFVALPRFTGRSRLSTWLFRITYNACMDELRRRRSVVPLFDQDAAVVAGPEEAALSRRDLADALATLPADYRAAVLLVDAYGFDYAGAATILGVREGTVASRLNRARTALRRVLSRGEP